MNNKINKYNFLKTTMLVTVMMICTIAFSNVKAIVPEAREEETNENTKMVQPINNIVDSESVQNTSSVENIFDTKSAAGVFKFSQDKDIFLPFFRFAQDRIIVDKDISKPGTLVSNSNIEVNAPMKSLHALIALDSVRINSSIETASIFATNNIIIEGNINKPAILIAGKDVTISENAVINDDIIIYANTLNVNGTINGNVLGACEKIVVNGKINKDLRVEANEIDTISESCIKGNILINTYNNQLNLKDTYPNAVINIAELKVNNITFTDITNCVITCLLFTLVFITIKRKSKNDLLQKISIKFKNNFLFATVSGTIMLLIIPLVILALLFCSLIGLYAISIPILIAYIMSILVIGLVSTLIIGSLISNYMSNKYFKQKGGAFASILGTFFIFVSLYILARLPYVGTYITMALVLLSVGIVVTSIFKKNKIK